MIKKIEIENYKSIDKLDFEIGQFNVCIGENGCGKTNILEAIAFASSFRDMDKGLLSLKGVRLTEPKFFRNGFDQQNLSKDINIALFDEEDNFIEFSFNNANEPYSKWQKSTKTKGALSSINNSIIKDFLRDDRIIETFIEGTKIPLSDFILYAPENYFLRHFHMQLSYLQPLGNKGEGLLELIRVIKKEKPEQYKEILNGLRLIDWFSNIDIDDNELNELEFKLTDKYLEDGIGSFDIENSNEGFFLLLFYITLFVSDYTPSFFAIDNIDNALNPKLCTKLIEVLAGLAKKHNKQVLITTHNPAILDGINLNDPEQRLLVVSRNNDGYTRVRRIEKKPPLQGEKPMKLSEQFLRGYIGGLPKNF